MSPEDKNDLKFTAALTAIVVGGMGLMVLLCIVAAMMISPDPTTVVIR